MLLKGLSVGHIVTGVHSPPVRGAGEGGKEGSNKRSHLVLSFLKVRPWVI